MPRPEKSARLDEKAGRSAGRTVLRRYLATSSPAFLTGAVDNSELGNGEMELLLLNRQAPAQLLQQVGDDRRWVRYYRVRRALALHPRCPVALAREQVLHLYWRELLEVSTASHVHPLVRRLAERSLLDRLDGLPLGARVDVARRAGRGLVEPLCRSVEKPVLQALLGNPRLVECDAVAIAGGATAPPDLLEQLGQHPRWGRRRDVLLALAGNNRTPRATALGLTREMAGSELRTLSCDPRVPTLVRVAATRRLERRRPREAPHGAREGNHA